MCWLTILPSLQIWIISSWFTQTVYARLNSWVTNIFHWLHLLRKELILFPKVSLKMWGLLTVSLWAWRREGSQDLQCLLGPLWSLLPSVPRDWTADHWSINGLMSLFVLTIMILLSRIMGQFPPVSKAQPLAPSHPYLSPLGPRDIWIPGTFASQAWLYSSQTQDTWSSPTPANTATLSTCAVLEVAEDRQLLRE